LPGWDAEEGVQGGLAEKLRPCHARREDRPLPDLQVPSGDAVETLVVAPAGRDLIAGFDQESVVRIVLGVAAVIDERAAKASIALLDFAAQLLEKDGRPLVVGDVLH